MDSDKSKADVTINVSTADIELGIANVIVALQRCGAIDMPQFLGALEQTTSQTHWKGKDGQQNRSQFSQSLIRHLNKLSKLTGNEGM